MALQLPANVFFIKRLDELNLLKRSRKNILTFGKINLIRNKFEPSKINFLNLNLDYFFISYWKILILFPLKEKTNSEKSIKLYINYIYIYIYI